VQALQNVDRDFSSDAFMDMAVEEACTGVVLREGGPFGAVITKMSADGKTEEVLRPNTGLPQWHPDIGCLTGRCQGS